MSLKASAPDKDTALVHEPPCILPINMDDNDNNTDNNTVMATTSPTVSSLLWELSSNDEFEFLAKLHNMTTATMNGRNSPTYQCKQSLPLSDLMLVELECSTHIFSIDLYGHS